MQDDRELKACPFCGGKAFSGDDCDTNRWQVVCCTCGACVEAPDERRAIAAWNHRPASPADREGGEGWLTEAEVLVWAQTTASELQYEVISQERAHAYLCLCRMALAALSSQATSTAAGRPEEK